MAEEPPNVPIEPAVSDQGDDGKRLLSNYIFEIGVLNLRAIEINTTNEHSSFSPFLPTYLVC